MKTKATPTSKKEITVAIPHSIQKTISQTSEHERALLKKLSTELKEIYGILEAVIDYQKPFQRNNLHGRIALQVSLQDYNTVKENLAALGFLPIDYRIDDVFGSLKKVLELVAVLLGESYRAPQTNNELKKNLSRTIFPQQVSNLPNIMVTMPTTAASNYEFMLDILRQGANYIRINTAHDSLTERKVMARFAKVASIEAKQKVTVYTDLASRKLRTGKIKRVFQPIPLAEKGERTRVIITKDTSAFTCIKESSHAIDGIATVVLSEELVDHLGLGHEIHVTDMRNKKRKIRIIDIDENYCLGVIEKKTLIDNDSLFTLVSKKHTISSSPLNIRPQPATIFASEGDTIRLDTKTTETYAKAVNGKQTIYLAISDPEVLEFVSQGDRLALDDGKIRMKIIEKKQHSIKAKVTFTSGASVQIKEEKGVNFPDSSLDLPALTVNDKENLEALLEFTDIIGLSFCQSGDDVRELGAMIGQLRTTNDKKKTGIVAKIETKKAVHNLVSILETLIEWGQGGIMIARGDLAVEVGFTELASVQQHILNLCKAAHIPAIYATGVMEKGMKKGLPTRAEITDTYNARQADCIMINKGEYLVKNIEWIQRIYAS